MVDATFEKVTTSDKPLFGPRKLLLCGFPSGAQPKFGAVLEMAGMREVPRIWVSEDQGDMALSALLQLPDNSGESVSSNLPRAIVVAGISQNELINLMTVCKKAGMMNALWATLTPTSENWTIQQLLAELAAERKAMTKKT
ncbi:MAG: DUF3783 domain-containing protein [Desulfobacterales bacterium]|nr:DUF3783 domain-containing protein [Desulfobacterales bacterium]MDX2510742.1 DUF3783 domain-containing protein [Desulfobacterales bacterium]